MDLNLCFAVLIGCLICYSEAGKRSALDRLTDSLLQDYNKHNHPDVDGINATHGLQLIRIVNLKDEILTIDAWVNNEWTDKRLEWDPEKYEGIKEIRLPSHMIWKPDIVLYNSAGHRYINQEMDTNAVIDSKGSVWFIPQMQLKSYCATKSKEGKGPSKESCALKFGSWTYPLQLINLQSKDEGVIVDNLEPQLGWRYKSSSLKRNILSYECCPETYVNIVYIITMKYKPRDM